MGLRIIYGTAGTGKSTYIFKEIQEKLKKQYEVNKEKSDTNNLEIDFTDIKTLNAPIKIITPEQFSFTAEQKLLTVAPSNSVLTAEVITFNRMAYRILEEVGGKTRNHLSTSGRAMLLDDILLTQKNDFTFLGKTDENVDIITRQLTEQKKHNVSVDSLKEYGYNIEYLINDLHKECASNIMTEYEEKFSNLNIKINKLIARK